jgi:hypothetical protein
MSKTSILEVNYSVISWNVANRYIMQIDYTYVIFFNSFVFIDTQTYMSSFSWKRFGWCLQYTRPPSEVWSGAVVRGTNRKVAGSVLDGVIVNFHWHNPAVRTKALESTQPLTEMSTRNISVDKDGRNIGLTTLQLSCACSLEIREPQIPVTLSACPGL